MAFSATVRTVHLSCFKSDFEKKSTLDLIGLNFSLQIICLNHKMHNYSKYCHNKQSVLVLWHHLCFCSGHWDISYLLYYMCGLKVQILLKETFLSFMIQTKVYKIFISCMSIHIHKNIIVQDIIKQYKKHIMIFFISFHTYSL